MYYPYTFAMWNALPPIPHPTSNTFCDGCRSNISTNSWKITRNCHRNDHRKLYLQSGKRHYIEVFLEYLDYKHDITISNYTILYVYVYESGIQNVVATWPLVIMEWSLIFTNWCHFLKITFDLKGAEQSAIYQPKYCSF